MVVGVCLESVHYHECQHACFNQEPSSIPNTALLNGPQDCLLQAREEPGPNSAREAERVQGGKRKETAH
ncbi:hypothetical protein JOQ06_027308 [Pogonophryne albipinna]|uniref:Uncharacterized protein n=2 Tax=Notothenioidei TaxID=8205 RepID=A0AAD6FMP7_9TELE|nr:hypothetical protein KUCAC02_027061 [Chaenocephalus aceratus]KAJ4941021.1 hypothetical protein JOQ06_027308 [Pogonophryne albipinna]